VLVKNNYITYWIGGKKRKNQNLGD